MARLSTPSMAAEGLHTTTSRAQGDCCRRLKSDTSSRLNPGDIALRSQDLQRTRNRGHRLQSFGHERETKRRGNRVRQPASALISGSERTGGLRTDKIINVKILRQAYAVEGKEMT